MAAILVAIAGCSTATAGDSATGTVVTTVAISASAATDDPSNDTAAATSVTDDPPSTTEAPAPTTTVDSVDTSTTSPVTTSTVATRDTAYFVEIEGPDPYVSETTIAATTSTTQVTNVAVQEPVEPGVPPAPPPPQPIMESAVIDPAMPSLAAAFNSLAIGNSAISVTVWRDHAPLFALAAGIGAGGQPVTTDTPLALASVSKLITSLTVARLAQVGVIQLDAPVPWDLLGIARHPGWNDVTVRELLDHTSGMPKAAGSWTTGPGSCSVPLTAAMARSPSIARGKWLYSNGNYCALGLLIEATTGVDRGTAAIALVFDPIGVTGPHLTTDGQFPTDGPLVEGGVARLDRLGGAGTWFAASDDVAAMLDSVTADDMVTMAYPAIMADQYGWGHTGTITGAKACAWVMDQGRTIMIGIVSGNRPDTGGEVCDVLIPALAADLGIWADKPHRLPG